MARGGRVVGFITFGIAVACLAAAALLSACGTQSGDESAQCGILFGRPSAATGLTDEQCQPCCVMDGVLWEAPDYDAAFVEDLKEWTLLSPFPELTSSPYGAGSDPDVSDDQVCAVVPDPIGSRNYRLETFPSLGAAQGAGAYPTHYGACGVCSTLADLAVYILLPDLTAPVRKCGIDHIAGTPEENIACLQALGFTLPCAQIWYYNTVNTRTECLSPCTAALGQPYHLPDGTLNDCLSCDEEKSGNVFKAVAGRTRRNTGLANVMCRPCDEVRPLVHSYPSF
jgi:hypothetical protein